jgi:hypothetical protein
MKLGWLFSMALAAAPFACHETTPPATSHDASAVPGKTSATPVAMPFGPAAIDSMLRAEWVKESVTPSARVDDARFVRRAFLDVVGTIPPPDAVLTFVADKAPDKRARLVEQLLASPAYAAYWATVWEDTLVGWQTKDQEVDRGALRAWLESQFAANTPWDRVVAGLLTAEGRNSLGGKPEGLAPEPAMVVPPASAAPRGITRAPGVNDEPPPADGAPVNGAVNWIIKYRESPADLAGNASRLFLGVQIQCAQCHDHKTEKWKQDDFRRFAACFVRTRSEVLDKGKTMGRKRVDVVDIGRPLPRYAKNPDVVPLTQVEPTALDGSDMGTTPNSRRALAAWLTAKDNPWFAKAIVNRLWGHFLGRGFVDPIDDLRPSNPPVMPELFDLVSTDFVAHGMDLKALIRTITATEAYQLAPVAPPAKGGASSADTWAHFHMTPLGPNELLRSLLDATGVEGIFARNANANLERIRLQLYQRYTFLFDTDETSDAIDFEGTIAQALTLLNGAEVGGGISAIPGGALDAVLRQPGSDADKIATLYRRTIARAPTDAELAYWTPYVGAPHPVDPLAEPPPPRPLPGPAGNGKKKNGKPAKGLPPGPDAFRRLELREEGMRPDPRRQAYEDVFWALLNSSEFTFNH